MTNLFTPEAKALLAQFFATQASDITRNPSGEFQDRNGKNLSDQEVLEAALEETGILQQGPVLAAIGTIFGAHTAS